MSDEKRLTTEDFLDSYNTILESELSQKREVLREQELANEKDDKLRIAEAIKAKLIERKKINKAAKIVENKQKKLRDAEIEKQKKLKEAKKQDILKKIAERKKQDILKKIAERKNKAEIKKSKPMTENKQSVRVGMLLESENKKKLQVYKESMTHFYMKELGTEKKFRIAKEKVEATY